MVCGHQRACGSLTLVKQVYSNITNLMLFGNTIFIMHMSRLEPISMHGTSLTANFLNGTNISRDFQCIAN